MKASKYIFDAIYEHRDGSDTTITIIASDFSEALKKAEDPNTISIAQAGAEDVVELTAINRGERVDVE